MDKNIEKRLYDLVALSISGDISTDELRELEVLLSQYPVFSFLRDELMKPDYDKEAAEEHAEQVFAAHYYSKIYLATQPHNAVKRNEAASFESPVPSYKVSRRVTYYALTMVMLVMAVLFTWGYGVYRNKKHNGAHLNEMVTSKGSKSKLLLPDGTSVVLNANSKISYSNDFNQNSREVVLIGEAYFEVEHNETLPFIVHTSQADIKVLGTVFNVRDYPGETKMEASLLKGSIELSLLYDKTKKILLKPFDKISIDKLSETVAGPPDTTSHSSFTLSAVSNITDSIIAETSWLDDKMAFRNKSFAEIAANMEQKYGVKIIFENPLLKAKRYTGVFDDTSVEDMLGTLQLIYPFQYRSGNNEIIIY